MASSPRRCNICLQGHWRSPTTNSLVNSIVEKQRKEALETCVLGVCQGRLTAIEKNEWFTTINGEVLSVHNAIWVLLVRELVMFATWWSRNPGSFDLVASPLLGPPYGPLHWILCIWPTAEGQEWRIIHGRMLWPPFPLTFHWPELINMLLPNFRGGWETGPLNKPHEEREKIGWTASPPLLYSSKSSGYENHNYMWVNWAS